MKYTEVGLANLLKDSRFQDIGALPSQFLGYSWKQLYIRPFNVADFRLIGKASALDDMGHMLRAIDLVITQPASELTIGDFYYIMMWLRVHSLPKTPLVVTWSCTSKFLQHKETGQIIFNDETYVVPTDPENYNTVDCNTENTESLHMVHMDIMSLEDDTPPVPEGFDFPRAVHIQPLRDALRDPELVMMAPGIQWMEGATFQDRITSLFKDTENGLDRLHTAMALNTTYEHGVREIATTSCRTCRIKQQHILNMTPTSFFQ